jgi:hypothetical protein
MFEVKMSETIKTEAGYGHFAVLNIGESGILVSDLLNSDIYVLGPFDLEPFGLEPFGFWTF